MTENKKDFGEEVYSWWIKLQKEPGDLARLRRQSDALGIESIGCFYDLVSGVGYVQTDTLAYIAMAISHVDVNSQKSAATLMGKKQSNSDHAVSELRFNKLISLDLADASRELVRILPLIDSAADVRSMATDLRYWDSDKQISKKKWLNDYYTANRKETQ